MSAVSINNNFDKGEGVMTLLFLWAKLFKKIAGKAVRNSSIDSTSKIEAGSHVVNSSFGRYSYCGYNCEIYNTDIGAFSSIANWVSSGLSQHPVDWVSTSPVFREGRDSVKKKYATLSYTEDGKRTRIGNDVWIGEKVLIKQGVTIGDGAIIGMGSVVTKDIEPYTIVGGNPARVIRKRFSDDIITKLLEIKWWELDDAELEKYAGCFNDPEEFIRRYNA